MSTCFLDNSSVIHNFKVLAITKNINIHCKNKLVVLTTEWLPSSSCGHESFSLVLETEWIRQPEKQVHAYCVSCSVHLTPQ